MRLSVIVPARDEDQRLPNALEAIAAYQVATGSDIEVVVVDAGSTDATARVALSYSDRLPSLRVVSAPNTGTRNNKGLAVRTGMLAAQADLRCFIDADNAAPFAQIDSLLSVVSDHDVVIGSRYMPGGDPGHRSIARRIVSRGGNIIFRAALHISQRDTHCPLKLYTAPAAELLFGLSQIDGLGFDAEVLAIAAHRGLRVAEVPVMWRHVEGSSVRLSTVVESLSEVGRIRRSLRRGDYGPGAARVNS